MSGCTDSLCQSFCGLYSWPLLGSVPTPSASLSLGRKSHRFSAESPCLSGPPSRWMSSDDRDKNKTFFLSSEKCGMYPFYFIKMHYFLLVSRYNANTDNETGILMKWE